jgi:DNA-binding response OmpR family regulator
MKLEQDSAQGGMQFLVVEKDRYACNLLKQLLGKRGEVRFAHSAVQGIREVQSRSPSLIVLSLNLADDHLLHACRKQRASDGCRIIVVSSNKTENERLLAVRNCADGHLIKPYSQAQLRSLLGHLVD